MEQTDLTFDLAGEKITLLPERAMYWPRAETLFVADTHWGKAATFRAAGVWVPHGTTAADLERLSILVERTAARRLAVLGDFFHAREGLAPETLGAMARWRATRPALEILVVRGNHDLGAGDPPAAWNIHCVDPPHALGPFVLENASKPGPLVRVPSGDAARLCGRRWDWIESTR